MERGFLVRPADLRLHAEVPERPRRLDERTAEERAARLIRGKDHVARDILRVKLAHTRDHDPRDAPVQERLTAAQAREHPVIGHVAAALVERDGEQQPSSPSSGLRTVLPGGSIGSSSARSGAL